MPKPNKSSSDVGAKKKQRDGKSSGGASRTGDRVPSSSTQKGRESRYPNDIMEPSNIDNDTEHALYNDPSQDYSSSQDYQTGQALSSGYSPLEPEDYQPSKDDQLSQPNRASQGYQPSQEHQHSREYLYPSQDVRPATETYNYPTTETDDYPTTETYDSYLKQHVDPSPDMISHLPRSSREKDPVDEAEPPAARQRGITHTTSNPSRRNAGSSKDKGYPTASSSSHSRATDHFQPPIARGYQREPPDDMPGKSYGEYESSSYWPDDKPSQPSGDYESPSYTPYPYNEPNQPSSTYESTLYEPDDKPSQASRKYSTTPSKQHKDYKPSKRDYKPSSEGYDRSNQDYLPKTTSSHIGEPNRDNHQQQMSSTGAELAKFKLKEEEKRQAEHRRHVSRLEQKLQDATEKSSRLEQELQDATEKSSRMEQERQDAMEKSSRLEQERQDVMKKSRSWKEQLIDEQGTASQLREEVFRLQGELEKEKMASSSKDYALRENGDRISQVEAEKSAMSRQLSQQVSTSETDLRRTKRELQSRTKERDSKLSEAARLTEDLNRLRGVSKEKSDLEHRSAKLAKQKAEAEDSAKKAHHRQNLEAERRQRLEEELGRLKSEIREERSQLSSQLEQRGNELAEARNSATNLSQICATKTEQLQNVQEELKRLRSEDQAYRWSTNGLSGQLEQKRQELARAEVKAAEGRQREAVEAEEHRALLDQVAFLKAKDQEAQREAEKHRALLDQVASLEAVAQEAKGQNSKLTSQLEQNEKELAQARNTGTKKEAIKAEQSRELQLKVDVLTLETQKDQSEISKLTRQLEQQREQWSDGRRKIQELSELVQRREIETKSRQDEVLELTEQMKRKDTDLERKGTDLERAFQVRRDLEAREESARDQLEKSEKERSVLIERLKRSEETLGQERLLVESAEQHKSELEKHNAEIADLRSQIKDLQDREHASKQSSQEIADAWKKERDMLRQTRQQSIDRATTLEAEVARLERHLQEARIQVQTLLQTSPQNQDLEHSLQRLQEELERSQDEKTGLEEREMALKGELNKVQSQLDHSRDDNSDLETKLLESTQRNHDLDNQIYLLTRQLEADPQSRHDDSIQTNALIADLQFQADSERKRANGLKDQLQEQKAEVKSMRLERETLWLDILDKQSRLDTYRADATKLAAAKRKLEVNAESDKKTIESLKATNQALANGANQNFQELNTELEKNQEAARELEKKIGEQENRLKVQDAYISRVQTVAWDRVKDATKDKSMVIDDDALTAKLQIEVGSGAQQWASKYASRKPDLVRTPGSTQDIGSEIEKVTGQRDLVAFCIRYDTDLVVHAVLSHFVTEHILQKPFLIFKFEFQEEAKVDELMANIYRLKLKANPTAAHEWRCSQLWSAASSRPYPAKPSPSAIPAVLEQNNPTSHAYFQKLATQFVNGPAKALLSDGASSTSAIQTIVCILLNAAQAALWMWRHPMEVQIREFDQLKALQWPLAEDGNGVAETHRRQTAPAASRARRRDAVVDMVVQPAIVAAGKNGVEKVWSRGVVLWN